MDVIKKYDGETKKKVITLCYQANSQTSLTIYLHLPMVIVAPRNTMRKKAESIHLAGAVHDPPCYSDMVLYLQKQLALPAPGSV